MHGALQAEQYTAFLPSFIGQKGCTSLVDCNTACVCISVADTVAEDLYSWFGVLRVLKGTH